MGMWFSLEDENIFELDRGANSATCSLLYIRPSWSTKEQERFCRRSPQQAFLPVSHGPVLSYRPFLNRPSAWGRVGGFPRTHCEALAAIFTAGSILLNILVKQS